MAYDFRTKQLKRINGVRKADKKTNRGSFTGVLPWFDLGNLMGPSLGEQYEGIIEVESLLEHDFVVRTRFDGVTTMVRPQPEKLKWWDPRDSRWRTHVPDFEAVRTDRNTRTFVQVKPKKFADRLEEDFILIRRNFERLGFDFEVMTELEIRKQPRFANAQMLFPHTGPMEDVGALDRVRTVLREAEGSVLTMGEIRRMADIGTASDEAVLRLHVRSEIRLDLDVEIDERALVHPVLRRP
ncbi:Tn7 transposase TnsA N-terminal domain-containing protein [Methylorubrum thiocyanatum]|uniref:Tn7 transposase TnsA N-terminal domain-containing protein n=1 Tax=Methylorubrum thiocyanatum TaxID=47958 RepID=UPI00383AA1ED